LVSFPVATFEVSDRHFSTNNIYSRTITTRSYIHDDSYTARVNGLPSSTTTYTVGKNVATRFIVGGNSLSFSNNGIQWYPAQTNISLTAINALEYNGTVYVAGGSNVVDSMAYSENGTVWYGAGKAALAVCNAIRWGGYGPRGGGFFVAVGNASNGNSIAYSLGGLHWTGMGNAMFGGNSATVQAQAIEWNGNFWLAGAAVGATYALSRSGSPIGEGWTSIDISNIANSIYNIMWDGSKFLIGGNTTAGAGLIAYSTNNIATTWTTTTCPITTRVTGMAYNGNRVVAVGNGSGNTIAYSDNFGITWTGLGTALLPNTSPTSIHKVAWHINKFIIAGTNATGRILYSSDGLNWKIVSDGGLSSCHAIVSSSRMQHPLQFTANGVICANYVSYDGGYNWQQMFADNISVANYNGKYAIFGQGENGNTYVAYDPKSAFKITTANSDPSGVRAIEWNGSYWLMGGVSHGANSRHLLLSHDGYNWKPVATNYMTSGYYVTGMDWSPQLGRWCVSVQTGANTNQIIYSSDGLAWSLASTAVGGGPIRWTGTFFMAAVNDSPSTKIAISQDGITWTTRTIGSYGQVLSIAADETATTLIIATYPNSTSVEAILKSTDGGASWTPVGGTNQNYRHTCAIWDGLRFLVKTDNNVNSIRSSFDGTTWTDIGGNLPGLQLAWTKPYMGYLTIYQPTIACGKDSGGNNTMAFSNDGIFFKSLGNTLFSDAANYAGWNGRMWIACGKGSANSLAYSYDGISWTGLGKAVFSVQANHVIWNGVRWVAAGEGTNTLATSVDGISWTGLGTSVFDVSGLCVQWNSHLWLAGGAGSTNTLAYSADGISWTGLGTSAMDLAVNDVQWVGTQWIVAGRSSSNQTLKYSTDPSGSSWTAPAAQPFATSANSVFWNGQITVAVGEGGNTIASSTDLGITWTGQGSAIFSTRGNEVAWNDRRWVAAGAGTNTLVYSNDGSTWWPVINNNVFTEGLGLGTNSKIGSVPIRSAITLNNRDKVCVNTPLYHDSYLADDTSLVFNLDV
jgi:hypothetical protein